MCECTHFLCGRTVFFVRQYLLFVRQNPCKFFFFFFCAVLQRHFKFPKIFIFCANAHTFCAVTPFFCATKHLFRVFVGLNPLKSAKSFSGDITVYFGMYVGELILLKEFLVKKIFRIYFRKYIFKLI